MKIEDLLEQVADGYHALIETAELAGIHVDTIASGIGSYTVYFTTTEGVHFSVDMRPIVQDSDPIEAAVVAIRQAHDAAKRPSKDMN